MINIMLLAGKGQRFKDAGYKNPKPLIDIDGEIMLFKALECLPPAKDVFFVCNRNAITDYQIDECILKKIPSAKILIDDSPMGQASSAFLVEKHISKDATITIGACDSGMIYNHENFNAFLADTNVDFCVWTFRNFYGILNNPDQYSYCEVSQEGYISRISLKKTISTNPLNDHCVVGTFTFKKAGDFFENYLEMASKNDTINGELYIDNLVNYCLKNGLKGKVFEIDTYLGFGTPNDVKTYQYWFHYFKTLQNEQ